MDTLIAGVHFFAHAAPAGVGHKAAAVNLSDMAAMGAAPRWLQVFVSGSPGPGWLDAFSEGVQQLALIHEVIATITVRPVAGGSLRITVAVGGEVDPGRAIRRDGGQAGDRIVVTGTLGDAGGALRLCFDDRLDRDDDDHRALIERLERPTPRIEVGRASAGLVSAGLDLSDGLAGDIQHLLRPGLGAEIEAGRLPLHPALRRCFPDRGEQVDLALNSGDDYELCMTVPPEHLEKLQGRLQPLGVTCTDIGRLREGDGLTVKGSGQLHLSGYQHFGRPEPT